MRSALVLLYNQAGTSTQKGFQLRLTCVYCTLLRSHQRMTPDRQRTTTGRGHLVRACLSRRSLSWAQTLSLSCGFPAEAIGNRCVTDCLKQNNAEMPEPPVCKSKATNHTY